MNPRTRDPITLAHGIVLVHGYWYDWGPHGGTNQRYSVTSFVEPEMEADVADVRLDQEGTRWVRGHVTENDPAGRALLTVAALKPAVIDLRENSRRFVDNEISATEFQRNVDLWDEALARGEDVR